MSPSPYRGRAPAPVRTIDMNRSVGFAMRVLSEPGDEALLVLDTLRDGAVVGLLTQRDIFRAIASEGPEIVDKCVWLITPHDFVSIDANANAEETLRRFCERKVDHVAVMDGVRVVSILNIWDCVNDAAAPAARP